MKTVFLITDQKTGEEVHRVETEYTGSMLDRVRDGLYRKTDLERFFIAEETDEPTDGDVP